MKKLRDFKKKEDRAIIECFTEIYKNSTPSGDFEDIFDNAIIEDDGKKKIEFDKYKIDIKLLDKIIEDVAIKYKFKGFKKQQLSSTIYLGPCPKIIYNL